MPSPAKPVRALKGTRILSLALNVPGPVALMRCRALGATCVKLEPPAPAGDPLALYSHTVYDLLHQGVRRIEANLKTAAGQKILQRELAKADVLLTSFRPSALVKLGLDWKTLHRAYPALALVAIVGAPGARAEEAGHDLTYQAESGLIGGLELPTTLLADMGGALLTVEAILAARLQQRNSGTGVRLEVALSEAAGYLALPHTWGLTTPGTILGGQHAGYRVYPCQDGRVALAALEPHFAARLAQAVGLARTDIAVMFLPETQQTIAAYLLTRTRAQLQQLARERDIPLYTLV